MKKIAVKALILSVVLCFSVIVGGTAAANASTTNPTWECEYGPTHSFGSGGGRYVGNKYLGILGMHYYEENSYCTVYQYVKCYLLRCPCGYEKIGTGEYVYIHSACGQ